MTSLQRPLIGWIDIRDLFTHDLDESLHDVMHTNIISVLPEEDQEEVARISTKYDLSVVPVVNKQNVFMGSSQLMISFTSCKKSTTKICY